MQDLSAFMTKEGSSTNNYNPDKPRVSTDNSQTAGKTEPPHQKHTNHTQKTSEKKGFCQDIILTSS
jgi:hypothetical protein